MWCGSRSASRTRPTSSAIWSRRSQIDGGVQPRRGAVKVRGARSATNAACVVATVSTSIAMAWCISASVIGTRSSRVKIPSAGLQRNRGSEHGSARDDPASLHGSRHVIGVQQRAGENRIGKHPMVKLHGECVLEKIPPQRGVEEEPRALGQQRAVDQRPGVVDVAGAKPGHQCAKIDLRQHQKH